MKIEIKPYNDSFIAVSFPEGFNTDLLNSVRTIPKRIWNNDEKLWLVPNTQEALNQLKMNVYNTGLFNVDNEIQIPDKEQSPILIKDSIKRMQEILKAKNYSEKRTKMAMAFPSGKQMEKQRNRRRRPLASG